jgi:hypothetical protein
MGENGIMERKQLTKLIFDALYDADVVFTKEYFAKLLHEDDKTLHESAISKILKSLVEKLYLTYDGQFFVKTQQVFDHPQNQQTQFLQTLAEEYSNQFDTDYVREQYVKYIIKQEKTPVEYHHYIEDTYYYALDTLLNNKTVRIKNNQFESREF